MQFPGAPVPMQLKNTSCLTAQDAADFSKVLTRDLAKQQECRISNIKTSAERMTFDMACAVDGPMMTGTAEVTWGNDWYKSVGTMETGRDVLVMKSSAKWIGAQCTAEDDADEE